jgi:co-chaperonin GroES (HSP10)
MKLYPKNKYLLVQKHNSDKEKQTVSIAIPEGYKMKIDPHSVVLLLDAEEGSRFAENTGDLLVVPTNTIESVSVEGQTFLFVSENVVIGVINND